MKNVRKYFEVMGIPKGLLYIFAGCFFMTIVLICAIFSTLVEKINGYFQKSLETVDYKMSKSFK